MTVTSAATERSGRPGEHSIPAVSLRGLHKSFGTVRAVDGIDLTVAPGEVVAFLGPNGAGKTTTIDMLLGLARPTRGDGRGLRLARRPARSPTASSRPSCRSAACSRTSRSPRRCELTASLFHASRPVAEVLERAGIADIADRRVGKCSGGQQQRLRFALALLPDPDVLVLDEPTTGMDVEGRRDFWTAHRGRTPTRRTHP